MRRFFEKCLLISGLLLAFLPAVRGESAEVGSWVELGDAILRINGGDPDTTLRFARDIRAGQEKWDLPGGGLPTVRTGMVVEGNGYALDVDAERNGALCRVLWIDAPGSRVTVRDLRMQGGYLRASGNGGDGPGVRVSAGDVTLERCVLAGNRSAYIAGARGGGLHVEGGRVVLNDCVVADNVTTSGGLGGGGVSIDGGNALFVRCSIVGNRTWVNNCGWHSAAGGGVSITGGTAVFRDCRIEENDSVEPMWRVAMRGIVTHGGGAAVFGGRAVFEGCSLSKNVGGLGGGLFVRDGSVVLKKCSITENTADVLYGRGGGLYVEGGSVQVVGCSITRNETNGGTVGGVYVTGGTVVFESSEIAGNTRDGRPDDFRVKGGGAVVSLGKNRIGVATFCSFPAVAGDRTNVR